MDRKGERQPHVVRSTVIFHDVAQTQSSSISTPLRWAPPGGRRMLPAPLDGGFGHAQNSALTACPLTKKPHPATLDSVFSSVNQD